MDREAILEAINSRVERYSIDHNIKKECIAERIGIGRTTFYMKLRGNSDFSLFEATALARLFGCTVDELISTEEAADDREA